MHLRVEISESQVKQILKDYLQERLGRIPGQALETLRIEVKSKQNYRSEWEPAAFRAVYEQTGA